MNAAMNVAMSDYKIPIGKWVAAGLDWLERNDYGMLDKIGKIIDASTGVIENSLMFIPFWLLALGFIGVGYWRLGWKFALFCAASLLLIANMGFSHQTVVTLALIFSATLISLTFGIPLGIWAGRNDRAEAVIRPIFRLYANHARLCLSHPRRHVFWAGARARCHRHRNFCHAARGAAHFAGHSPSQ